MTRHCFPPVFLPCAFWFLPDKGWAYWSTIWEGPLDTVLVITLLWKAFYWCAVLPTSKLLQYTLTFWCPAPEYNNPDMHSNISFVIIFYLLIPVKMGLVVTVTLSTVCVHNRNPDTLPRFLTIVQNHLWYPHIKANWYLPLVFVKVMACDWFNERARFYNIILIVTFN